MQMIVQLVTNESKQKCKEEVVAKLQILPHHLLGTDEENNGDPQ